MKQEESIKEKIYVCKKHPDCKRWTKIKDLISKNSGLYCPRCREIAFLPNTEEFKAVRYDK